MNIWFAKRAAPIAALALGAGLAGCDVRIDSNWGEVEGVALEELDMSGEAPDTIQLAGPDRVIISEGDELTITLEGDAEAGEALRFDRNGDRLTIARDQSIFDGSGKAIVRMTLPAPENLEIAGSGEIQAAAVASNAELEIAGSGSITVDAVDAERLEVDIAGSGDVRAAGTADTLDIDIAGSGNVRLGELLAEDVSVGIAGSGDVELASNGRVDASIAGSGDVRVTGSATCHVTTAGSGSLTCRPADTADEAATQEGSEDASEDAAETGAEDAAEE
ncbi:head GIN domain-containing protein [uncultured Erythrobacter sp.]|uniref:head GIN domain-containing protein n=1 Tax=uncultured Erythrobacter sp. TaxID=263913 RepID=UPI002604FEB6|nr:head GIN domain-containing protein [uncultured Erythrobacter sp.]